MSALRKETVTEQVSVDERGNISIGTSVRVYEGDTLLGESRSRRVIRPGDDVKAEDETVQAYAAIAHTPERIASRMAEDANKPRRGGR